ncbi:uncharacterized protein JCM6883_001727 [Sporobolomyces salmoneus]|uniref:uncharacterized protein n=1 Tax=Sporobolomyces salmoneus TaxID=183962 RepID=UPI0031747A8D
MSDLPTVNVPAHQSLETNVKVPHKHKGGTYLRQHLGVGAHKGDRNAQRLLKSHAIAFVGEFVGTTLFCFFAFAGTTVASLPATSVTDSGATSDMGAVQPSPNTSSLLYVALSFGFSLAVNIQIFSGVSGGIFNPAISLGLALIGAHTPIRALILTAAEVIGAIAGAAIVSGLLPGPLNVRTTLVAGTSVVRGLFIEMFLTMILMLTVLVLTVEESAIGAKKAGASAAPVSIGLALFLAEMVGVFYTGGSLNPARSLGPDVVIGQFDTYHWIYWLGPALGATVAVAFWKGIQYVHFSLGPRTAGTPDASKMLLETDEEKGAGSGPPGPQGNNGAALQNTTSPFSTTGGGLNVDNSDARSIVSVVAEPVDRMTLIEQSNSRIETMLSQLMNGGGGGGGSPLSTIGSSMGNSLSHRKISTEQTLHENELHGTDHLQYAPSRGSQYSTR